MKQLPKIISLFVLLALVFSAEFANAQSNIDVNRMNRDINIMENILQEIFKTQIKGSGDNIRVHSIDSYKLGRNNIRGTYLPGYGVIFNVNSVSQPFVLFQDDDNTFSYSFQHGDDKEGKQVTKESIVNRIVEFLRDYGSTIGQLSGDDRVMVIYNGQKNNRDFSVFRPPAEKEKKKYIEIPTISVVATKNDLQAYRSGDLSDEAFRNRLDISTAETDKTKQKDLRIMADIFETAFKDTDEQSFRVSESADYLKLDNFGALFSFDARYAGQSRVDFSNFHSVKEKLEQARTKIDEDFDLDFNKSSDSLYAQKRKVIEAKRIEHKENVKKAYEQFLTDLKSTIADYGRTLHSVDSNQQILVTVNLHNRHEDIPDRIDLQVRKSALENSSRDQAINQITVREY